MTATQLVRYGALHGILQRFVPHALSTFEGTPMAGSENFLADLSIVDATGHSGAIDSARPRLLARKTSYRLDGFIRQLNGAASRPRPPGR